MRMKVQRIKVSLIALPPPPKFYWNMRMISNYMEAILTFESEMHITHMKWKTSSFCFFIILFSKLVWIHVDWFLQNGFFGFKNQMKWKKRRKLYSAHLASSIKFIKEKHSIIDQTFYPWKLKPKKMRIFLWKLIDLHTE